MLHFDWPCSLPYDYYYYAYDCLVFRCCEDDASWSNMIKKTIRKSLEAQTACVVLFETSKRLNEFDHWLRTRGGDQDIHAKFEPGNHLTPDLSLQIQTRMIKRATRQYSVTLTTREFGRGTDFVCYDSSVKEKGGVMIIQTFFAESLAEETQIKGRTGRQDDPGRHVQILYHEDLAHLIEKDGEGKPRFGDLIAPYNEWCQSNGKIADDDWDEYLEECRQREDVRRFQRIRNNLAEGQKDHSSTLKMAKQMLLGKNVTDTLLTLQGRTLQGGATEVPKEVVFVLDYSGSMSGQRIDSAVDNMVGIYDGYIQPIDRCAFIRYGTDSETVFSLSYKSKEHREMLNGSRQAVAPGTCTRDAVASAISILEASIAQDSSCPRWIIVLTDGDDNGSNSTTEELCTKLTAGQCSLIVITVGMGIDSREVKRFCDATNSPDQARYGLLLAASDARADLDAAFAQVAVMLKTPEMVIQT